MTCGWSEPWKRSDPGERNLGAAKGGGAYRPVMQNHGFLYPCRINASFFSLSDKGRSNRPDPAGIFTGGFRGRSPLGEGGTAQRSPAKLGRAPQGEGFPPFTFLERFGNSGLLYRHKTRQSFFYLIKSFNDIEPLSKLW
jgi:hypothetical protein